jgi:membrane-associated phospholipid phosphatase
MNVDLALEQVLYAARSSSGVEFFSFITDFAGAAVVIAVCCIALWILHSGKRWEYALGLLVSVAGSAIVCDIIKELVARPRPPVYMHAVLETTYSFPSSHATAAVALYGFLALSARHFVAKRFAGVFATSCVLLILAVGFSRLYLGVHYLSDVLAGYLLGALFVWLGLAIARRLERLFERMRRV